MMIIINNLDKNSDDNNNNNNVYKKTAPVPLRWSSVKNVQCAAGPRAPARPDSSCVCVLFSLIFVCQTSEPSHAALATAQNDDHTQYNIISVQKRYTVYRKPRTVFFDQRREFGNFVVLL